MKDFIIINIKDEEELKRQAALWFHEKWGIPKEAYEQSMNESLKNKKAVPQWYVVKEGDRIVGGVGVIENDFHERKDLTPNICALYVEEDCRCLGKCDGEEMMRMYAHYTKTK